MDKNPTLRKDLVEAWQRYVSQTDIHDDLALILNSIKDGGHVQEFTKVFDEAWEKVVNELPPASEERKEEYRKKAAQLLAEYENRQRMQQRRISLRNNIIRLRKVWYAAAAVLLIGLLTPVVYHLYTIPEAEQPIIYVEAVTQRGEIKTVVLPDQTEVTLNAGSSIKYLANFSNDKRSVELYGEALFNVTSDLARPFTVNTEKMNIRVVGTVFSVTAYDDDLTTSVSVASGKVEVGLADKTVMLGKNQQVKMNKATGNIEKTTIDAGNCLSWTTGTLYFDRTPIREVVNILNRHFPQVDIELADGDYYYLITGKYNNVKHPDNIIKGIAYTLKLEYKKTDNKYTLYKEELKIKN